MNHTCTKVTVRQRAIRNDRISLYLDYYPAVRNPETMQMSRREYLGIYLYAHPKNEMERAFNNEMLNKQKPSAVSVCNLSSTRSSTSWTRPSRKPTFLPTSKRCAVPKMRSGLSCTSISITSSRANALSVK